MNQVRELDINDIHPPLRRLVTLLREHGFDTCDSGDGVTNVEMGMEMALDYPHVYIATSADAAVAEARRCHALLAAHGVEFGLGEMREDESATEFCDRVSSRPALVMRYEPAQDGPHAAFIEITHVTDADLRAS
jgi:hypothetical protein